MYTSINAFVFEFSFTESLLLQFPVLNVSGANVHKNLLDYSPTCRIEGHTISLWNNEPTMCTKSIGPPALIYANDELPYPPTLENHAV